MKKVRGEITLPGDKSISHRAGLFSALRDKESYFTNFNYNQDCTSTLNCLEKMGIEWERTGQDSIKIKGFHLNDWKKPDKELYAGNSGTTARLISGILCNAPFESILTGDESLSKRPMKRVIDPLELMGAKILSNQGLMPLHFQKVKKTKAIKYKLPVASAQVKSCVLLSGLFAEGETEVIESKISRDHTERMIGLNKNYNSDGTLSVFSSPDIRIPDLSMKIPGDFSSAAFFIVASLLLPGSEIIIKDVSLNPTRTGLLTVLEKMGAKFEINEKQTKPEPFGDILVTAQNLKNIEIPLDIVPNIIDEIPVLSILASQSDGTMILHGAGDLRHKESDRISMITGNFRRMGMDITEYDDGFEITGPQNIAKSAQIETKDDHRIAMAFGIANLITEHEIIPDNPQCADVSFPGFWSILERIIED
ncbi:MAG: 3-phosphoshikimate 1-carboxyvinyltransferase [Calditrichaceae bacterium]|nr:3-phosphoshikimate 1-carboxyvinyltransferase [Calditrichaceae bacterium]MBN2709916.1 3-phosphoshikimate 1-carboxyvinyltransferase [Calditrichaceae bacterium]RQV92669.1 MAG: 3-phosphoshikimate 1-carboxyvinyltransferase [Calditrichota bacterium]